jgi:hypothetical protein
MKSDNDKPLGSENSQKIEYGKNPQHRRYSEEPSRACAEFKSNKLKENLYPGFLIESKISNPLTNMCRNTAKKQSFLESLQTIEKSLENHYKKVEKLKISPETLSKLLLT